MHKKILDGDRRLRLFWKKLLTGDSWANVKTEGVKMTELLAIRAGASRLILTVVFILSLAAPAFTDYDAGLEAYKRGDYEATLREWLPLAEKGNAKAQNAIGVMHAKGKGFPQDYTEAIKWYRKAAEGGYTNAMSNIGLMYASGEGVAQDFGEAAKWQRMAAERGHHGAQHNLARLYAEGRGVPQDYVQAYMWMSIAGFNRAEDEEQRQAIAAKLTPEQIAAAKKKADEWKAKK